MADPLILLYAHSGSTNIALATGRFGDLAPIATAMHRPELRFAALTLAFAGALPGIAIIGTDRSAGTEALIAGGATIMPYVPFEASRLVLEGARHALALGDLGAAARAATLACEAAEGIGSAHVGPCRVVLARVGEARGDDPATLEGLAHAGLAEIEDAGCGSMPPTPSSSWASSVCAPTASRRAPAFSPPRTASRDDRVGPTRVPTPPGSTPRGSSGPASMTSGRRLGARRADRRGLRPPRPRPARRPRSGWASLTPTELDVARLVAAGHTNPDIAERLFVSRSTVKTHLVHVYAKLELASRAELAAAAVRHGLD